MAGGFGTDYDYQYYDSDFRLVHQDLIEDDDDLLQTLNRNSRWTSARRTGQLGLWTLEGRGRGTVRDSV